MYVYVQIYDLPFRNNKKNIKVKVFTNINDAYNELKVSMINDGEVPPSYFDYYGNPIDFLMTVKFHHHISIIMEIQ